MSNELRLWTVGHGTLDEESFVRLARAASVELVVDVRSFPGSRRNPQYGREAMKTWLPAAGIGYEWERRLGGRRRSQPDSVHVALRNESFRAYADHMATVEFSDALGDVVELARARSTAVMCSESVWWRCHRRLLADAAVALRGVAVDHLFHDGRADRHTVTPEARVEGGVLVYDAGTLGSGTVPGSVSVPDPPSVQ